MSDFIHLETSNKDGERDTLLKILSTMFYSTVIETDVLLNGQQYCRLKKGTGRRVSTVTSQERLTDWQRNIYFIVRMSNFVLPVQH